MARGGLIVQYIQNLNYIYLVLLQTFVLDALALDDTGLFYVLATTAPSVARFTVCFTAQKNQVVVACHVDVDALSQHNNQVHSRLAYSFVNTIMVCQV